MSIKPPEKATRALECRSLEQIPNIGYALAADLRSIGIQWPADLIGRNAFALYLMLCKHTGVLQDPSVLDTFLSAVDFMSGSPAAPWWHYTAIRKEKYGQALQTLIDDDRSAPHRVEEAFAMYGP